MASIWKNRRPLKYDYRKLINRRVLNSIDSTNKHIVCDIDKTYLETDFDSVMKLVKIPFEDAEDKITVDGANEVLSACRWGFVEEHIDNKKVSIQFVSSSPPQLRSVLTDKLLMDNLDWDSDTFKNQAYNLRKGRVDQLNQHVVYKSAAIAHLLEQLSASSSVVLIGDNAEMDAYIYLGLLLLCQKKLTIKGYTSYLELAGVAPAIADDFTHSLKDISKVKITGIFIRKAPGYHTLECSPFTEMITKFENYFQCALQLSHLGFLNSQKFQQLGRSFHNKFHRSIGSLLSDTHAFLKSNRVESDLELTLTTFLNTLKKFHSSEISEVGDRHVPNLDRLLAELPAEDMILQHAEKWIRQLRD